MLPKFPDCEGRQIRVRLRSQGTKRGTRGNGLNLCHGKFRLDTRRTFSMGRVTRHWKGPPREVVECPSTEMFKEWLDVALRAG